VRAQSLLECARLSLRDCAGLWLSNLADWVGMRSERVAISQRSHAERGSGKSTYCLHRGEALLDFTLPGALQPLGLAARWHAQRDAFAGYQVLCQGESHFALLDVPAKHAGVGGAEQLSVVQRLASYGTISHAVLSPNRQFLAWLTDTRELYVYCLQSNALVLHAKGQPKATAGARS
jgi:hypothetical protein